MPANLTTKLGQLVDVLTPDTTNTRIGVANASPTRTLDVTGTGAISTSLAIGGATIGTNAIAVTGTSALNGLVTATKASAGDSFSWTNGGATPKTGFLYSDSGVIAMFNVANAGAGRNGIQISSTAVTLDINAGTNTALFTATGLGIGGTPANQALNVFATSTGTTSTSPCGIRIYDNGFSNSVQVCSRNGQLQINANSHVFLEADVEIARFDSSGNLLVGGASGGRIASWDTGGTTNLYLRSSAVATRMMEIINTNSNGGAAITFQYFQTVYGAAGTIVCTTTNTAYNTSSDYRMKENVQPMTGGLSTIAALKPVIFDWIPSKTAGEGFIAHELQAVIPAAVSGEKDAVNEDGSINAQGVDFGKIVPHLVVAIQELTTRLAALESK